MELEDYKHKESECPSCHKVIDASMSTSPDGQRKPKHNDISVCCYCGQINRYNEDLTLREITRGEINEIKKEDPVVYRMMMNARTLVILKPIKPIMRS